MPLWLLGNSEVDHACSAAVSFRCRVAAGSCCTAMSECSCFDWSSFTNICCWQGAELCCGPQHAIRVLSPVSPSCFLVCTEHAAQLDALTVTCMMLQTRCLFLLGFAYIVLSRVLPPEARASFRRHLWQRLLLSILRWLTLQVGPSRPFGRVTTSLQLLGAQGSPGAAMCQQLLADTVGWGRC